MRAIYYLRSLLELQAAVGHVTNAELAIRAGVAPNTISAMRLGRAVTARKAYAVWQTLGNLADEMQGTLDSAKGPQRASFRLVDSSTLAARAGKQDLVGLRDGNGYLTEARLTQAVNGAYMTRWYRDILTQALCEAGVAPGVVERHFIEEPEDFRIRQIVDEGF